MATGGFFLHGQGIQRSVKANSCASPWTPINPNSKVERRRRRSAGFPTCCIAGFQPAERPPGPNAANSSTIRRLEALRYSRLGSLRYGMALRLISEFGLKTLCLTQRPQSQTMCHPHDSHPTLGMTLEGFGPWLCALRVSAVSGRVACGLATDESAPDVPG